jgi:hypothetical protein
MSAMMIPSPESAGGPRENKGGQNVCLRWMNGCVGEEFSFYIFLRFFFAVASGPFDQFRAA